MDLLITIKDGYSAKAVMVGSVVDYKVEKGLTGDIATITYRDKDKKLYDVIIAHIEKIEEITEGKC